MLEVTIRPMLKDYSTLLSILFALEFSALLFSSLASSCTNVYTPGARFSTPNPSRKSNCSEYSKQDGFTLFEVLITTSLSSALILLLFIFLSHCIRFYFYIYQSAAELESGRYASFFLRTKLKNISSLQGLIENEPAYRKLNPKKGTAAFNIMIKNQELNFYLFVSKIDYAENSAKKQYALFIKEEGKPRIEIANNIWDMKVVYGIRCPHSLNVCNYVTSQQVADWKQVVSLKLSVFTGNERSTKEWRMYIALPKNF
jgi:Type IV Pilus-assembly protein W